MKVTLWIKNDDEDIWNTVYSPEWLHQVLEEEKRQLKELTKEIALKEELWGIVMLLFIVGSILGYVVGSYRWWKIGYGQGARDQYHLDKG